MNDLEQLIREYVKDLIEIRSKKDVDSYDKDRFGSKFNINTFSKLTDGQEIVDYAAAFLERLGKGSSRIAFVYSGKYALKVARSKAGIAQNNAEIEIATNPAAKKFVASIYKASPDGMWIISDIVRKATAREFMKFAGCSAMFLTRYLEQVQHLGIDKGFIKAPSKIARQIAEMMIATNLVPGDIGRTNHWGVTADGRFVILDYGFTESVNRKHYAYGRHGKTHWSGKDPDRIIHGDENETGVSDLTMSSS